MLAGELQLRHEARAGRHMLSVAGELDMATAPELVTAVVQLVAPGAERIVIDMGGVTFMDSTGLRGLLVVRELCQARGCRLELTIGQRQVQRVIEVAGVDHVLPFTDSSPGEHHARGSYRSRRQRFEEGVTEQYVRHASA